LTDAGFDVGHISATRVFAKSGRSGYEDKNGDARNDDEDGGSTFPRRARHTFAFEAVKGIVGVVG
jgi:hypothetical protein